jgi:predicted enzyme related to lactoylglutathione lyase
LSDYHSVIREYPDLEKVTPLLQYVDCWRISVPDLEQGLRFYRDELGHKVLWRLKDYVGLQMPDSATEIVLDTHPHGPEIFMRVKDVGEAVKQITAGGGKIVVPPYEIEIGLCAVVQDPWGNQFVIVDISKGLLVTDAAGNVTGLQK